MIILTCWCQTTSCFSERLHGNPVSWSGSAAPRFWAEGKLTEGFFIQTCLDPLIYSQSTWGNSVTLSGINVWRKSLIHDLFLQCLRQDRFWAWFSWGVFLSTVCLVLLKEDCRLLFLMKTDIVIWHYVKKAGLNWRDAGQEHRYKNTQNKTLPEPAWSVKILLLLMELCWIVVQKEAVYSSFWSSKQFVCMSGLLK